MCIVLLSYKQHTGYPLVLLANRDEFYSRKAKPMAWNNGVLAGTDLVSGGTWFGLNEVGSFAAITNHRNPDLYKDTAESRGPVVPQTLRMLSENREKILPYLATMGSKTNPFNLLYGDHDQINYYSSVSKRHEELSPGLHGLSNAFLNTPWPKTEKALTLLHEATKSPVLSQRSLLNILTDRHRIPEKRLPKTGISRKLEEVLSSVFIESTDYGTRCSTICLWNREKKMVFCTETTWSGEKRDLAQSLTFELPLRIS